MDKKLAKKIAKEYNKVPSIRMLVKKYNMGNRTIRKYIIAGGEVINFKKGSSINYKSNSGSFKKGQTSWNRGKKMSNKFRKTRRRIMNKEIKKESYIPLSLRPGVADKISKSKIGKLNAAWKGGITEENKRFRSRLVKASWSKKILKRDNYTCKDCNKKKRKLHAHHIRTVEKYPELANVINNGITLCIKCHTRTYKNEQKFEKYFQNIVEGVKILTILSTRPEIIRQCLIIKKLDKYLGKNHILVFTGQNYDKNLYNIFLKDLNLRKPDYIFNIKKRLTNHQFIGQCMLNVESLLKDFHPKYTIVNILGDVNGAFASAYIAKRLGFKIIHNESGNRANADILEEINRKAIDTMSNKLLCYSQRSRENLLKEGRSPSEIIVSGNPLGELVKEYYPSIYPIREDKYILMTLHRNETINNIEKLKTITKALKIMAKNYNIVLSVHPSLKTKIKEDKKIEEMFTHKNIELCKPFNYTSFLNLMKYSVAILSDSGGECEEAALLGVPCLVLRHETERTELLEYSQMILCGTKTENILKSFEVVKDLPLLGIPEEYLKPTSSIVVKIILGEM